MPVVEARNLTFAYSYGKPVLSRVNFSIGKGETMVITGHSGSGKTTLCHLVCGLIPRNAGDRADGEITVLDINPIKVGPVRTALRTGLVFQDADSQIICQAVEDEVAFGLENLCVPPQEIRQRVDNLLHEFGLYEKREYNPRALSGGHKKLLTIASVLAYEPPVLVLDEPLRGLDDEARNLVRRAIERQRRHGRTILISGHSAEREWYSDYHLTLHSGEFPKRLPGDILP